LIELGLAGFGAHLATEAFRFTVALFTLKKWMGDNLQFASIRRRRYDQ